MPLIESAFKGSRLYKNGHFETIFPSLFRSVAAPYKRERFHLPDSDFIDLDRIDNNSSNLIILLHGLEGNSDSKYIKGLANLFAAQKWDVCAMNFRSCSGEMNKLLRSYHSGVTDDLDLVVKHLTQHGNYKNIAIVGFSLGGNMLLKYLGEKHIQKPAALMAAVSISAPVDLKGSSDEISKPQNKIYLSRFMRSLTAKMILKSKQFPGQLNVEGIRKIDNFPDFDDRFTAPIHGFKDSMDYYNKCSSIQFLPEIKIPVLMLSAENDPFLSPSCYPTEIIREHPFVYAEYPLSGGHVGFSDRFPNGEYWSEIRVWEFIAEQYFH